MSVGVSAVRAGNRLAVQFKKILARIYLAFDESQRRRAAAVLDRYRHPRRRELKRRTLTERGAVRRNSGLNQGLIFAAVLYLSVAIVELSIVVLAAPGIVEIGSLYVPVP